MFNENLKGRTSALEYGLQTNRESMMRNAYNSELIPLNSSSSTISRILNNTSSIHRLKLQPIHSTNRISMNDSSVSHSLNATQTAKSIAS